MTTALPEGFARLSAGRCTVVTRTELIEDARLLLEQGTLYDAAARTPGARTLQGRGIAYSLPLPASGERVVVRRNRHGGLLAPVTGSLFLPPTRAPYELDVSLRLAAVGVRTPAVAMYGVESVGGVFRRADVVTREVAGGRDLSIYMLSVTDEISRAQAWSATRTLVRALNAAGARHHDLNIKNVLLAPGERGLEAWVLDVDRVVFGAPGDPAVSAGNTARLLRSARKWRDERDAIFDEREIAALGIRSEMRPMS